MSDYYILSHCLGLDCYYEMQRMAQREQECEWEQATFGRPGARNRDARRKPVRRPGTRITIWEYG